MLNERPNKVTFLSQELFFNKQRYMRYHKIFTKTISPKHPSKTQKQVPNQTYRPFAAQTPLTKEVVNCACAVVSATPSVAYC